MASAAPASAWDDSVPSGEAQASGAKSCWRMPAVTTPPPTIPREAPATEVGSAPNSAQQPSAPPAEVLQALPPPPAPPHPPYQVHASSPTPSSQLPPPLNAPRQLGSNSAQHFPRVCSSSLVPITETSATVLPVLPGQKPSSPPYHPSLPFCPSLTREPNPTYSPFWPQVPNCRLSCAASPSDRLCLLPGTHLPLLGC